LRDKERKVNEFIGAADELRETINLLCAQAGLSPRFPTGGGNDDGTHEPTEAGGEPSAPSAHPTRISPDSFFGKRQATAIRELLEMRRAGGDGPARPREIYDSLRSGGYTFKAKDDETALVGLRALLRKNSVFLRVPGTSGAYGLRAWYPHVQAAKAAGPGSKVEPKGDDQTDDDGGEAEARPATKEAAA
jgi:hypothetical protein